MVNITRSTVLAGSLGVTAAAVLARPFVSKAQAQTATSCTDMRAAMSNALASNRGPMRCGVSQLTAAAAIIDTVPARMTE